MAHSAGGSTLGTITPRTGSGRTAARPRALRAAVLLAGVGLLATGCANDSGSLLHLTGTNTEFCVPASEYTSVGSVLPLHLAQDEDPVTIREIVPLNAEGAELGETLLVPTVAEGAAGYGEFGPSLVEKGRGEWSDGVDAEGATLDPGANASLVVETRATGEGEAAIGGYRITYEQDGYEHTVTVRQAVEIKDEGVCAPAEGGGDGREPALTDGE